VIRRLRTSPLEELLVAQAIPGFLLAVAWTAMYEVYHEEGGYYLSLLQEILETEGLFPSFLLSAVLMAFPLGMIVDSVRYVVGEAWLRLPDRYPTAPAVIPEVAGLTTADPAARLLLQRQLEAARLVPAKAAGNLAVILLALIVWFVVKIYRMQGWHVFSWAFLAGTPLAGLAIAAVLLTRYRREMRILLDSTRTLFPVGAPASTAEAASPREADAPRGAEPPSEKGR